MANGQPAVLLVTTQTWHQFTRLGLRLVRYGARVHALCPPGHDLRLYAGLSGCWAFAPGAPLRSIKDALEACSPDYVIPGDDRAVFYLHALAEHAPGLRALVERSLGSRAHYPTVASRAELLRVAASLGIAVPDTAAAPTADEALRWCAGRKGPTVLKRDGTFGGEGVAVVHGRAEIEAFYAAGTSAGGEVCAQAFVEGKAANAMFAARAGRVVGAVAARVVASKGKTGPSVVIQLVNDRRMLAAGELLAQRLGLSGFFGLDFLEEEGSGVPLLIELNPRCTQLGHVALPGKPDLVGALWSAWTGARDLPCGAPELSPTVCFYPGAQQWATHPALLAQGRPDVCADDLPMVDALAAGGPEPALRVRRWARRSLVELRNLVRTPAPLPIHYFGQEWLGGVDEGGARARQPLPQGM